MYDHDTSNAGFCLGIPEWRPKTDILCVVLECLRVIEYNYIKFNACT